MLWCFMFFCKQKTAYEMRISDGSSDVCSSDRTRGANSSQSPAKQLAHWPNHAVLLDRDNMPKSAIRRPLATSPQASAIARHSIEARPRSAVTVATRLANESASAIPRSEEHTSELQSLMRTSYAVFCLQKHTLQTHRPLPPYLKRPHS